MVVGKMVASGWGASQVSAVRRLGCPSATNSVVPGWAEPEGGVVVTDTGTSPAPSPGGRGALACESPLMTDP